MSDMAQEVLGRKAKIIAQGKVVVEPEDGGYLVMFPDGTVEWKRTRALVVAAVDRWFHANLNGADMGIGTIEWR